MILGNFVPYAPEAEITHIFLQKLLLRDIYDSKNHSVLDGFQDQVFLPIDQLFHCLKGKVDNVSAIGLFLKEACQCFSGQNKQIFENLVKYFLIDFSCKKEI